MATNPNKNAGTLLLPEIGPDGLARESPAIAYTEKIIEEEQLQLRKYIEENYTKIRDVERELANLSMEMKLTAGPKKAALEHLRKKIEISTERIHVAKLKEGEAKKAWEAAAKAVQDEEAIKQKLCEDLSSLSKKVATPNFLDWRN
ncbi:aci13 [Castilleja foliolosa]|uniref:Aci13 n=1 Tax=Castilleja foliolosa TaxID=1961234 RepID=A0ABD3EBP9_9LAMI